MFKLKGEVTIIKVDSRTQQITQVIKQENLIPDKTLLELLDWEPSYNYFGGRRVSISTSTEAPAYDRSTVNQIIATGYIPASVVSPVWLEDVEPPYGIIKNRIDFINSPRTFNTVAITALSSNNNSNNLTTNAAAYLLLTLPCTQGEFEFLDIQYRIQILPGSEQGFLNKKVIRYDFGRALFGKGRCILSYLYANWCKPSTSIYDGLYLGGDFNGVFGYVEGFIARLNINAGPFGWVSGMVVDNHYKFKYILKYNRDTQIGKIFNSMLQGYDNRYFIAYTANSFKYKEEPFQTGFWHLLNATSPFFDATFAGSSKGRIYLSGTWNGKLPELYKITIKAGGVTGTATYNLAVRKHLGFEGNNYNDASVATQFRNPHLPSADKQHGWREENNDILRWSNTSVVQYDLRGVTLIDVFDGTYTNWELTTTPSLTATKIRQVAVDTINQKIYVGCRDTGLWVINVTTNTIEHPLSSPCYGVDVGRNNLAVAIVQGGVYTSADWTTSVPFSYSAITTNWSRVWFLRIDPENINDQIAFVIDNSGINQIVWHQLNNNITTPGYQGSEIKKYPASFNVSDVGSFWAAQRSRFVFAENSINVLSGTISEKTLQHSIFGNDNYYQVSFYKNALITYDGLLGANNVVLNNYNSLPILRSPCSLHLDSGIILCSRFMRQLFSDNIYCWDNYGWDGSNWIKDNPNPKTTHTSTDTLINGLTIRFEDGAAAPQFAQNEYFTQGVNYGLLKDNATTIESYTSQWYSRDVDFNATFTGTIPISAPYNLTLITILDSPDFLRIETDTPQLHEFKINGVLVTAIYTNAEAPGPNEVTLNGNGVLRFNSADAGKSFNAKFTYVKI